VGDYKAMKARGVKFHGEPDKGPWGTGVLFEGLYGNKLFFEPGGVSGDETVGL
jgi:hypothetical protein